MASCTTCWQSTVTAINRKKTLASDMISTQLNRCLGISDLVFMGIGYMVGTGIFILSGEVVRFTAGAATIFSFLIAGVAAMLSALCYAEFSALVPLAGSAYTYTYVIIGELWAFLVGWNIMLEYLIMSASAAKSWSGTLDNLFNGTISSGIRQVIGTFSGPIASSYPDFMAIIIIALITIFVIFGPKTSSIFNQIMVVCKLVTIAIIIVVGFMYADTSNWTDATRGGFIPYGPSGILTGAAICFFAFVGFDGVAMASEEAINPRRTIPISIIVSLVVVTLLYILTTMVLTLLVPYYDVNPLSPFPSAFVHQGIFWGRYLVGIGTLLGLCSVTLAGLFALPRVIYAMARDGLLFTPLAYIHPKTQTPILSICIIGVASALLAFFLNLDVLVDLLSIGTLFSFTFVAAAVILVRYDPPEVVKNINIAEHVESTPLKDDISKNSSTTYQGSESIAQQDATLWQKWRTFTKARGKSRIVIISLLTLSASTIILAVLLLNVTVDISSGKWWTIMLLVMASLGIVLPLCVISSLEQTMAKRDTFQVPLVPFLPGLSIFCNISLMLMLDWTTWIRLVIWIIIGLVIYFAYGARHSKERALSKTTEYLELSETSE